MKPPTGLVFVAAALSGLSILVWWKSGRGWSGRSDRTAVEQVIQSQLDALRADDFAAAFAYAAQPLRRRFSPETFAIMVRHGYAKLVESTAATVLEIDNEDGRAVALVRVEGRRAAPSFFEYELVRESGGWRIAGVREVEAPFVTARTEGFPQPVGRETTG